MGETQAIKSARGGRGSKAPRDIHLTLVRSLTEEDLPRLITPDPLGTKPPPISKLRASHHQLAQLVARGDQSNAAISLITGYSPSRISILLADPTFQELVSSYTTIRQAIFVDTLERMKTLGLSTLDELQERLETEPERWSNRELMEMADLMLVKPRIATPMGQASALGGAIQTGNGNAGSIGVAINVQFVKSDTPPLTIDHHPVEDRK